MSPRMTGWQVFELHRNKLLVTNVLQEPFGWNFAALLLFQRLPVHPAADGRKLQALIADVAIERHLVAAGAAFALAADEIGEIGLVAALPPIGEFGRVAAEAGLQILLGYPLHLLHGAADE